MSYPTAIHKEYMRERRAKNKCKSMEQNRLAQARFRNWKKISSEFMAIDYYLFSY
jgi:hypothetical protein